MAKVYYNTKAQAKAKARKGEYPAKVTFTKNSRGKTIKPYSVWTLKKRK